MSAGIVGRLVVDFLARDAQFQATSEQIQSTAERLQQRLQGVSRVARRMFLVGGGAIAGFLKLAADQEQVTRNMESALREAGEAVDVWSDRLLEASNAMQEQLGVGNENAQALMTQAINMGIAAEEAEELTRQALGVAQAFGVDQQRALRAVARAREGDVNALRRYIPAIQSAANEAEALTMIQEGAQRGLAALEDEADTLSGRMKRLKEDVADVGKEIGNAFLPAVSEKISRIRELVPDMQRWIQANQEQIVSLTKFAAAVTGVLIVLPKLLGMLSLFVAHPVIFALTAMTGAVVGLTAALNDGEVAGINFGQALHRIAHELGLVRSAALDLLDAEQQANAERERAQRLQRELEQARGPQEELAALEALIEAEQKRLDLHRQIHRQEHVSELDPLRREAERLAGAIERAEEAGENFIPDPRRGARTLESAREQLQEIQNEIEQVEGRFDRAIGDARQQQIDDLRARADELRESLEPDEASARSFLDTLRHGFDQAARQGRNVWEQFANAMREAQAELEQQRGDFQDRLELFGVSVQQRQLIMLERTRDELMEQAEQLGLLTDEMESRIQRRFRRARERITADGEDSAAPSDGRTFDQRPSVQFVGLEDMFRRMQASVVPDRAPEEQTAQNTRRAADAAERQVKEEQRGRKMLDRIAEGIEHLAQRIDRIGTYGP